MSAPMQKVWDALEADGRHPHGPLADFRAACPGHDGNRADTLHVAQGDDGRALLTCHAECPPEQIVERLGLTMADLFVSTRKPTPVEAYPYVDEGGQLLFEVVRMEPKTFRQRRPDGRGGWIYRLGDVRRVLYRLPDVLMGIAEGRTIYIAEGEKDVHAIESAGGVATCNPGGVGKWRDEYSPVFADADVVVVADRDGVGRDHAADVARALDGVAKSITIVEAATGKDAADHLRAGHSLEAFVPCPVSENPRSPDTGQAGGGRFGTRAVDLTQLRPVEFAWRPWLIRGKLNLNIGEEGIGKSTYQAHIAAEMTVGRLDGAYRGTPTDVLFVGADEDDWFEVTAPRLYAAGADLNRVREFYAVDNRALFNVVDHIDDLDAALEERPYGLIVFEHLMDVLPPMKNPNDPKALRSALHPLRRLLAKHNVAGLGTLHVNKAQANEMRQKQQGGVQFGALSRSSFLVARHPQDPNRRVAVLGKANYVRDDEPIALAFSISSRQFLLGEHMFDVGVVEDVQQSDVRVADVLGAPQAGRSDERDRRRHAILDALGEEALTVREVERETGIPRSSVGEILQDLVQDGLAEKLGRGGFIRCPVSETPRNSDTGQADTLWGAGECPDCGGLLADVNGRTHCYGCGEGS